MKTTLILRSLLVVLITSLPFAAYGAEEGAALYKAKCALCHGATGDGDTPMGKKLTLKKLSSPEVQKISDADMLTLITKGKNKMPGFDKKLTVDQIKAVIAHVRTFAKK